MPKRGALSEPDAVAVAWYESLYSGAMSDEYKRYMREEWGSEKRGDGPLFEKLCLEGAQAGLSWATILAKREGYRRAFHNFDISKCARMTDADVARLLATDDKSIVRHRGKIQSVINNAKCVQRLIQDAAAAAVGKPPPEHGYFDDFLWAFVSGAPVLNEWPDAKAIPSESEASRALSKALKTRGFSFVGPTCCYSLMQSCGLVIDHPKGTPEWFAAKQRLQPAAVTLADDRPKKAARQGKSKRGR